MKLIHVIEMVHHDEIVGIHSFQNDVFGAAAAENLFFDLVLENTGFLLKEIGKFYTKHECRYDDWKVVLKFNDLTAES